MGAELDRLVHTIMTNAQSRLYRVKRMEELIFGATKKHGSCGKEKLVAMLMDEFNCSRRTCLEYLNMLINIEKVEETEGVLTWKTQ